MRLSHVTRLPVPNLWTRTVSMNGTLKGPRDILVVYYIKPYYLSLVWQEVSPVSLTVSESFISRGSPLGLEMNSLWLQSEFSTSIACMEVRHKTFGSLHSDLKDFVQNHTVISPLEQGFLIQDIHKNICILVGENGPLHPFSQCYHNFSDQQGYHGGLFMTSISQVLHLI